MRNTIWLSGLTLAFDPNEECLFVDEDATASPLNHSVKAVSLCVEDEVTETALGRPFVVVVPARNRYEAARCLYSFWV